MNITIFADNDKSIWIPVWFNDSSSARAFLPKRGFNNTYTHGYKSEPYKDNYLDAIREIQRAYTNETKKKFVRKDGKSNNERKDCWRHTDGALLTPKGWIKIPLNLLSDVEEDLLAKQIKESGGNYAVYRHQPKTGLTNDGSESESTESSEQPNLSDGTAENISLVDTKTLREIQTRRGQSAFRDKLFIRHNFKCAVSECPVISVLEAAHIVPHADEENYHTDNGILLKADIHTLYDLNQLGINREGVVFISAELEDTEYAKYKGLSLLTSIPKNMATNLDRRFKSFLRRNQNEILGSV